MKARKICEKCKLPLIASNGFYMHPDTVCNGIKDMIFIEATIEDEFLHEKFIELYGKPDMDDYDRIAVYERNPVVRFVMWLCGLFRR